MAQTTFEVAMPKVYEKHHLIQWGDKSPRRVTVHVTQGLNINVWHGSIYGDKIMVENLNGQAINRLSHILPGLDEQGAIVVTDENYPDAYQGKIVTTSTHGNISLSGDTTFKGNNIQIVGDFNVASINLGNSVVHQHHTLNVSSRGNPSNFKLGERLEGQDIIHLHIWVTDPDTEVLVYQPDGQLIIYRT